MPTPVITNTQLGWAFQTSVVENIRGPSQFLTTLIFGDREVPVPTESIELSYKEADRNVAPFVELNSEAIAVPGRSVTFANVSAPNMKMKRTMEAYQVALRRQPGTDVFIRNAQPVLAARAAAIAEDSEIMVNMAINRIEWMVAQMIAPTTPVSGYIELSYQVNERANFRIRIPRSTDMNATLLTTARWNDTSPNIEGDVFGVKRIFAKWGNWPLATAILGSSASNAFRSNATIKADLDKRNLDAGRLTLISQFQDSGAIYLGNVYGVDWWEYSREYVDEDGTSKPFIPADKAVFLAGGNAMSDNTIFYGAIPDHDAMDQGLYVGRRFSKAMKTFDPSVYTQIFQTRPLPMIRRPNGIYILDVL